MSCQIEGSTACYSLFNKTAESLFPTQDSALINQSLETLMKVVDYLVASKPEALFLFDPISCNNQCHLYALIATQRLDKRFFYHSFFLSYAFLTDQQLLLQVVSKALAEMNLEVSKELTHFLKEGDIIRIRISAARETLNTLFSEHMKKNLRAKTEPLYQELAQLANENLQHAPIHGPGTLYTLPKLAGVIYMADTLFKENIALLFKVKVIAKEGRGSFSYSRQNLEALDPKAPVVVFELIATDDSLSYLECQKKAKECPSYSQRNIGTKNRHKETVSCFFCAPGQIDVAPYVQKFQPVLEKTDEMLFALGTDFMRKNQEKFLPFFSDASKYPLLTELYKKSVLDIERLFLSMDKPQNMSVFHVYPDSAGFASQPGLVIEAPHKTHLEARKLI